MKHKMCYSGSARILRAENVDAVRVVTCNPRSDRRERQSRGRKTHLLAGQNKQELVTLKIVSRLYLCAVGGVEVLSMHLFICCKRNKHRNISIIIYNPLSPVEHNLLIMTGMWKNCLSSILNSSANLFQSLSPWLRIVWFLGIALSHQRR